MFQNREEPRRIFLNVWKKLQANQVLEPMEGIIADVIKLHPEYHAFLITDEAAQSAEFSPEHGQTNPFLHMGMHIALREQASTDRPPGIKRLHGQLCQKKGQHEAEHEMMECLGQALWLAQQNNALPDEIAYLDCLKKI